ncbi:MAG: ATP-binding protein [Hyphomicrobiales bacterium]|nr:MAG: ATP-binding protein [Hyphomicrobiales bacterium]
MQWSPQQDEALLRVSEWLSDSAQQVFRLFGYAGTGKTTLARHLAEGVGTVEFAAFTGKAAHVLRQKGCEGAGTIHSLIYRPAEEDVAEPSFLINRDSPAGKADLIIIDECSMVDEDLGRDLLSFGTKVLVLGDPAQLPPVKGGGFFTDAEPDYLLTEVHRQARDNPIIEMSMRIRAGEQLDFGQYGDSQVISKRDIDADFMMNADQALVGRNITRMNYNARMRALQGYEGAMPYPDERLICLRNNKKKGLLNGSLWVVVSAKEGRGGLYDLRLLPDPPPIIQGVKSRQTRVKVRPEFFQGQEGDLSWPERRKSDEFDFGYVLTVHKSQGSQWDNVVLFDESFAFREHRERWLYTGITRAAKTLTIVR